MFNTEGAACIGLDTELFFPTGNLSPSTERFLERTCLNCKVFNDCLNYSLRVKVHGYWAGTTQAKRNELRRFFGITPLRIDQELDREHRSNTEKAG
jgi:hypothetical protein